MAGFKCNQCGVPIIMEGSIQVTGCDHHPLPDNPRILQRRKNTLIQYLERRTGLKLRGSDTRVARQMISLMWNMGFKDEHIIQCADYYLRERELNPAMLTWPFIYRNIERWEKMLENKVIEQKKLSTEHNS